MYIYTKKSIYSMKGYKIFLGLYDLFDLYMSLTNNWMIVIINSVLKNIR